VSTVAQSDITSCVQYESLLVVADYLHNHFDVAQLWIPPERSCLAYSGNASASVFFLVLIIILVLVLRWHFRFRFRFSYIFVLVFV